MRWGFVLFLFAIVLANLAAHRYLWARIVRDADWGPRARRFGTTAAIGLAGLTPIIFVLLPVLPRQTALLSVTLPLVWLATVMFAIGILVVGDLVRAIDLVTGAREAPDLERRRFLVRSIAAASGGGALFLTGVSLRGALADVQVVEQPIALPRLPASLEGLSIVQLTDVHVGPTIGQRFTAGIAERVSRLRPDLVVITGDLVDGTVEELRAGVEPLARVASRFGTHFVTGNHEYYSGVEAWDAELRRLGIRVLRNERVEIGDAGGTIDLAGVDDAHAERSGAPPSDVAKALDGRDPDRELVLLAHQPKSILDAEGKGVGLQISGHTHGGQIAPMNLLVRFIQPYTAGWYRHTDGAQIYVSRGTGYWGPPMRLLAPPEITRFVLTRKV